MQPAEDGKIRLFVALDLPEAIRNGLAALRRDIPGCRWSSALHLTLRFIGEVGPDQATAARKALREVNTGCFSLTVQGLGLFARSSQTILWAGVRQEPGLLALKQAVDTLLAVHAGLAKPQGRFTPHITLARLKTTPAPELRAFVKERDHAAAGRFPVSSFGLFSSILAPGGAVHTLEERYPLAGWPAPQK